MFDCSSLEVLCKTDRKENTVDVLHHRALPILDRTIDGLESTLCDLREKKDEMVGQVRLIQNSCDHDFWLLEEPNLRKSLVPEYYFDTSFAAQCRHCSLLLEGSARSICPSCFSPITEERSSDPAEKYYGEEFGLPNQAVYISRCYQCGLNIVSLRSEQ